MTMNLILRTVQISKDYTIGKLSVSYFNVVSKN